MAYKIKSDCISCGACEAECPVGAISAGADKYEICLLYTSRHAFPACKSAAGDGTAGCNAFSKMFDGCGAG